MKLPSNVSKAMFDAAEEALLWSSSYDDEGSLEGYSLSVRAKRVLAEALSVFVDAAESEFGEGAFEPLDDTEVGHAFWLSSAGHGTGFFDSKARHAKTLQKLARKFEADPFLNEDDQVELG